MVEEQEEIEVFELAMEEEDSIIKEYALKNKVFLLSCIAPFKPLKVSPSTMVYASLREPEEFAIESFINEVKESNIPRENRTLELLLHSYGGDVNSAYMIAKVLRKTSQKLGFTYPTSQLVEQH